MKLRKITVVSFLMFFLLQTSILSPLSAFAQTSTDSASENQDNTLPINQSPEISKIPVDTSIPQLSLTGPVTARNTLRTSPVVQKLAKQYYRSDENVHIAINNPQYDSFHVEILDPKGNKADVAVNQVTNTSDQVSFDIAPRVEFHPGKYKLVLTDNLGKTSEQDFTWGVLAINMDRSVYTPGQTANLAMAVLNEQGNMVCDAILELHITNQSAGIDDTLSTGNGKITINDQCQSHNFSLKPDYEAYYPVDKTGTYMLALTAKTTNGIYTINDKLVVNDTVPFDVERVSATRIYPPNSYPVQVNITANQDFSGTITETVPQDFTITASDNGNSYDNLETVYLNSQKNPANQLAKQLGTPLAGDQQVLGASTSAGKNPMSAADSTLELPFTGSFPITEGFGVEQTDQKLSAFYKKYGLSGHDGVDFGTPVGTPIRAVDDGNILLAGPGDYGITIVIQHSWGKSYYGHLSKVLVGTSQHVTKGQEIALSGDTGESTGPHLHFGLKPNIPDVVNGYFGKIDPLPYFHLAPNASIALGAAPLIASATNNQQVLGASTSANTTDPVSKPQAVTDTIIPETTTVLTKQIRSQILDMPATPLDNKVKVLTWHVSVKKGDKISLGYTFKAPLTSPQFYLIGPLTFYPDGSNKQQQVFQEQRQWQIVADAVGTAWYDYSWQYRKQITIDHTKVISSVGVDTAHKSTGNGGTSVSSISWSHTTGSQSNRLLLVGISLQNETLSVNSVVFNNTTNLSLVPGGSKSCSVSCHTELWYAVNPPASTTGNIVVTASGTTSITGGAIMLYNVDQSNTFGTTVTGADTGQVTSFNVNVTTVANQMVVDAVSGSGAGTLRWVNNSAQTSYWSDNTRNDGAGSFKQATTTTTNMAWTDASADNWAEVAVPVNPSSLTNFPTLISETTDTDLQSNAQSTGNDILFTDSTGQTKLNHEIEKYTSGTGELEAWVNMPTLSTSADTTIYMYYGNASAASQQNATSVWDSNYLAVYHLGNDPSGGAPQMTDSTSHANNGTTANMVAGDSIAGQVDSGLNFNGSNKRVDVGTGGSIKGVTQYTISAWFNVTAFTAATKMQLYSECTNVAGTTRLNFGLTQANPGQITLNGRAADGDALTTFVTNSTTLSTATWYYATAVYDSTAATNNMHLMLNGTDQVASLSKAAIANTTPGHTTQMGSHCNATQEFWNGKIDELRLSNIARLSGWNTTEYNNMNSPATFATFAAVETKASLPSQDQLMRHGQWFCPTTECAVNPGKQPYTF